MIIKYQGYTPEIDKMAYVDLTAQVIGDVVIGEESSVWFNAVLRGDINSIRIGKFTNIQDGCILHTSENEESRVELGDHITVGHRAILHGCKIESFSLVGMGSVILDGAVVESESMVAAGAVVTKGTVVGKRTLVAGVPAKQIRELEDGEVEGIKASALAYARIKEGYRTPDEDKFDVKGFRS